MPDAFGGAVFAVTWLSASDGATPHAFPDSLFIVPPPIIRPLSPDCGWFPRTDLTGYIGSRRCPRCAYALAQLGDGTPAMSPASRRALDAA